MKQGLQLQSFITRFFLKKYDLTGARATTIDFFAAESTLFSLIRLFISSASAAFAVFMAANECRVWVGNSWNRSVILFETLRGVLVSFNAQVKTCKFGK